MFVYGLLISHRPVASHVLPANDQRPIYHQPTKRPPLTTDPATNLTAAHLVPTYDLFTD